jgi:hypothetical protein
LAPRYLGHEIKDHDLPAIRVRRALSPGDVKEATVTHPATSTNAIAAPIRSLRPHFKEPFFKRSAVC